MESLEKGQKRFIFNYPWLDCIYALGSEKYYFVPVTWQNCNLAAFNDWESLKKVSTDGLEIKCGKKIWWKTISKVSTELVR